MPFILPTAQHFFIEGRSFGSAIRGGPRDVNQHGEGPISYAFFCPDAACGRVWALAPMADRPFQVWSRLCSRHRGRSHDTGGPAGTLALAWDAHWTEALPEQVLRWELERELDYIESQQQEQP